MTRALFVLLCAAVAANAQGLDPNTILHPPKDSWPTFNGDYSGKRFSSLQQINKDNVGLLGMAWAFQTDVNTGPGLKSTPLLVDGTLYFTEPDDVWAVTSDPRGLPRERPLGPEMGGKWRPARGAWKFFSTQRDGLPTTLCKRLTAPGSLAITKIDRCPARKLLGRKFRCSWRQDRAEPRC